jgi:hypothetical protein
MTADLMDSQDINWFPSHLEAMRAHVAEHPRGLHWRRDDLPESDLSTPLNLNQLWGINHADAPDRRGRATPENLGEGNLSAGAPPPGKKPCFKFVRSSSVFYPPVERCPFTVRQYGGGRGAKMKPLLGCWASRAMPLNSRQSVVQCTARWSSNSGREVSQREFGELADFALAGPGVVLGRALRRFDSTACNQETFSGLLDASWNGLRAFLNKSWFKDALTRRGQHYTDAILEAVVDGNLESVLDEHLWITAILTAASRIRC